MSPAQNLRNIAAMDKEPDELQASNGGKYSLAKLALLSLLTGAAIGLVIGLPFSHRAPVPAWR